MPSQSLNATLAQRIQSVARGMVEKTAHSMDLEQQRPAKEALDHQVAMLAYELRRELPRWLWDEPPRCHSLFP